jgi:hypothetical protein
VALEATYGWEWLAELLEEAGYDVHPAHPLRKHAIAAARLKTDAVDAKTLAHLPRTELLPEAYIAPPEPRNLCAASPPRWVLRGETYGFQVARRACRTERSLEALRRARHQRR